jgi:hypothetical protein
MAMLKDEKKTCVWPYVRPIKQGVKTSTPIAAAPIAASRTAPAATSLACFTSG